MYCCSRLILPFEIAKLAALFDTTLLLQIKRRLSQVYSTMTALVQSDREFAPARLVALELIKPLKLLNSLIRCDPERRVPTGMRFALTRTRTRRT